MENLNEVIEKISEFLKAEAKTETVIGAQFKLGEFSCVPVMSVGLGFGGGIGEGKENTKSEGTGVGGGAGIGMKPIGFLVTKGEDIQFIPAHTKGISALFEQIPDLLEKFLDSKKKETEKV